ncbi:hypothetical protein TEA_019164 [Camellia sinensis var. sinensis]|uniref:Protein kinase domain-containing protein n=1 Tax=Camellia sinensis var. sinensis TaxID=542762 RepID=A0A4S4EIM4_CAMSN|nr:hypothetical protein TEA_019164 [Camellia sinensis var. sinensis]
MFYRLLSSDCMDIKRERWALTEEWRTYATAGSPELQVFFAIPPEGISPEQLQVASDFDFNDLISFIKSWRMCAFGHIATTFGFSHSSKCITGGVLSLEISFLFPLSTALSSSGWYRYKIIKEVGDGTFGTVWRAINKQTGEVSLRKMSHPNIVKLKEVIREHDILYFVFEYMDFNLYQLMKDRAKLFSEAEVKNWCFQVFQGLAYMHQRGYFHRDLKPENLLVSKDVIKIADFGLAREISSQPPYTEYVSTRWYRAPEVLLQSPMYNSAVDCSEADEIYKICSVIGTPTESEWAEGLKLASAINNQFPQLSGVHLSVRIPSASEDAINLITSCFYIPPSLRSKTAVTRTPPSAGTRGVLEHKSVKRHSGTLSNSKSANNFPPAKSHVSLTTGVQRKLEMNNQDAIKNDKFSKIAAKEPPPRYRPPARNSPTSIYNGKTARGVSETAEKLANMNIGSGRLPPPARQSFPGPMKAGGWHGQSDLPVGGRSQDMQPGRAFTRKVVG